MAKRKYKLNWLQIVRKLDEALEAAETTAVKVPLSEALAVLRTRLGMPEQSAPKESAYWRAVRTGNYPPIWPPISMTRDELEHFRACCRKAAESP